ncbi:MAG: 50S ribosomal protein L3 [Gammaproteobacteria bacterium]
MSIGIVGEKQGMTRVFNDEGTSFPVTVISAEPNTITQIKTIEKDGYSSVQVTFGSKKEKHLRKSELGHFKRAEVEPGKGLWEFRFNEEAIEEGEEIEVGKTLSAEQFEEGQLLDVSGISKGKGFAGTVKRWNFKMQDATHGNSISHRAPGSIGQCQTPGRVWKGKKMSGHMGSERVTTQNLKLVSVDSENNLLLVKGSVPGPTGSKVFLKPSTK